MKGPGTPRSQLTLTLSRDLVRAIKRGNPWVYAEALVARPKAPPGTIAVLRDRKGQELALGYYNPNGPLAFRVCSLNAKQKNDDAWLSSGLERALKLRRSVISPDTTGYRLINGEGDGLPGLICDMYADTAVLQFDGEAASAFWKNFESTLRDFLIGSLAVECVYVKARADEKAFALHGEIPAAPISFIEHGVKFTADVVSGQKTGFFLDQRENRLRVRQISAGRRVLNVFGYTGGFSVSAGLGGAASVTTVDIAQPALELADHHWRLHGLTPDCQESIAADAFEFLEESLRRKGQWDLVILDPPSFAPSQKAVSQAVQAYQRLIAAGCAVTARDGLLAAASCSSHVRMEQFISICEEAVSDARRRATVLEVDGQPADHPAPLALPEFRYLKFVLIRVED